jgi:hypothetical protein
MNMAGAGFDVVDVLAAITARIPGEPASWADGRAAGPRSQVVIDPRSAGRM